jgi:hypothetical protein
VVSDWKHGWLKRPPTNCNHSPEAAQEQMDGVCNQMSIDKESSGFPEVNVHRRTTKVNLWMIVGILVFFIVGSAAAFWISRKTPPPTDLPPSESEKK